METPIFLVVLCLAVCWARNNIVCKKGKLSKKINIGEGDSYSFKTQARATYSKNTKCYVTYKRKSSCPKMRFSCSEFSVNNKRKSCKGLDRMQIQTPGNKKSYCQKKGPDVTTSEKYLKVSFLSDKKKHGYGAVCRMECVNHTTVAPTTEVTGPIICAGCYSPTQVTPAIINLAKFATYNKQFPLLKSCGEDLLVKVLSASMQVVAGYNYNLTLAVSATVGEKCDRVSSFICTNVVVFRPLPFQCTGDVGSCDQLTKPDGIKCTADAPKPPPSSCICPALFAPVCAANGQTFSNHCSARCQGFVRICDGPCPCKLT